MQVGMIGMGRMGSGVASRLLGAGHQVVAYNRTLEKVQALTRAQAAASPEDLVAALNRPRIIWLYLPAGEVTKTHLEKLISLLEEGDTLIDGGNSHYTDTLEIAAKAGERGIGFIDAGTSGGIIGRESGYCLMLGGKEETIQALAPLWQAVAQEDGFARIGPVGSGHFVKMAHNAIEYGMLQAYGEGLELLEASRFAPELGLEKICGLWQKGSIITSFLGKMLAEALSEDPKLEKVGTRIDSGGEVKWALQEGIGLGVPLPVTSAALFARYRSQRPIGFAYKVVAIIRNKFGGHPVASANGAEERSSL